MAEAVLFQVGLQLPDRVRGLNVGNQPEVHPDPGLVGDNGLTTRACISGNHPLDVGGWFVGAGPDRVHPVSPEGELGDSPLLLQGL